MNIRLLASLFVFTAAVFCASCGGGEGKLYPVEGTVTLDGQPLEGATVTFANGPVTGSALTTASGKFKLISAGKEGVPAGTYKVVVIKKDTSANEAASAVAADTHDSGKAYLEMMKQKGMKVGTGGKGGEGVKEKSLVPEKYAKGALPDQVVPASGEVKIELSSK